MILILFFLLPLTLFAESFILDKHGLGLEAMIGGVGTARLGSSGAVNSNPALLAWLPKQKKFISSNQLRQYNQTEQDSAKFDFKFEIVPLYQATTEGMGDWGYGYGLNIDLNKIRIQASSGATKSDIDFEQQKLSLIAGAGKRWGHQALGLSAYLGRFSTDTDVHLHGTDSGFDFNGSAEMSSVAWSVGLVGGWAFSFENFVLGAGTKFNVAKFGAQSNNKTTLYSEAVGQTSVTTTHEVDRLKIIPTHSVGMMTKLGMSRIFLDWFYSPSYRDNDSGGLQSSSQEFLLGLDSPMESEKWKWYAGTGYSPRTYISKDDDLAARGSLSFGYQKKSEHSISFGGLAWSQAMKSAPQSVLTLTFGTQFDY